LDNYRRAASYVDGIFRGAKPTDLPVQLPIKFEITLIGRSVVLTSRRPADCFGSALCSAWLPGAKLLKKSPNRERAAPRSRDHPPKRRLRRRRFDGSPQAPANRAIAVKEEAV
jgi:hypothetical protein